MPGRITLFSLLVVSCGSTPVAPLPQDGATYFPDAEWRRASPAQVHLDGSRLDALVSRLQTNQIPGIHSLLVVKQGYLAIEEYFNGWNAQLVHTLQSDTKSVTSLLVGIAIDRGMIPSVDRTVTSLFPEYPDLQHLDAWKQAMTLRFDRRRTGNLVHRGAPWASAHGWRPQPPPS